MDPCPFDKLFTKNVPHLLEKILFPVISVDIDSFNTLLRVSKTWHALLNSDSFKAGNGELCIIVSQRIVARFAVHVHTRWPRAE